MNKGFTLIEVFVYIALLTILLTSGIVVAYQLLTGSDALNFKAVIASEGNFVREKMNWAFSNMDPVNPPAISGSGCNQTVTITKIDYIPGTVVLKRNTTNNSVEIKEGTTGTFTPVTTSNVSVSCLKFTFLTSIGGSAPSGIVGTTTINGIDFVVTKYIRK